MPSRIFWAPTSTAEDPSATCTRSLFVLLAELAIVHRVKAVEALLSRHFNEDWLKEYAEKRKKVWVAIPPP